MSELNFVWRYGSGDIGVQVYDLNLHNAKIARVSISIRYPGCNSYKLFVSGQDLPSTEWVRCDDLQLFSILDEVESRVKELFGDNCSFSRLAEMTPMPHPEESLFTGPTLSELNKKLDYLLKRVEIKEENWWYQESDACLAQIKGLLDYELAAIVYKEITEDRDKARPFIERLVNRLMGAFDFRLNFKDKEGRERIKNLNPHYKEND